MARTQITTFNLRSFLGKIGSGKTILQFGIHHTIFAKGDAADAVFFIQKGRVTLTVVSRQGKEAVIAILERGALFGEASLAGQLVRTATAMALEDSTIVRVNNLALLKILCVDHSSELFVSYLLARNLRMEEDLVDRFFNSAEKRLARLLLLLAHFGEEGKPEPDIPKIRQGTLAQMVGTTRSRVSRFLNKFRKLGFIDYSRMQMRVHSSLVNIIRPRVERRRKGRVAQPGR